MLSFCFGTFSGCQGGSEGHFRLDPTSENATWRQNGFTCRKKTADFGRTISLLNAENRAHICQGTVDILGAFSGTGNISATHNSAIGNVNRLVIVLQVMFYVTYDAVFTASVEWPNAVWLTLNCIISSKLRKPALAAVVVPRENISWFSVLTFRKTANASKWKF